MQDVFDEHDKPLMVAVDAPANTLAGSGMLSSDQLFPSHHSARGPLGPHLRPDPIGRQPCSRRPARTRPYRDTPPPRYSARQEMPGETSLRRSNAQPRVSPWARPSWQMYRALAQARGRDRCEVVPIQKHTRERRTIGDINEREVQRAVRHMRILADPWLRVQPPRPW